MTERPLDEPPVVARDRGAVGAAQPQDRLGASTIADRREETNGYWFWGLITLFIGVPEVLAALSKTMKADIPWPTISNLVGKHLEKPHHWIALIVMGLIAVVTLHTVTYPAADKEAGRAVRTQVTGRQRWSWGRPYIAVVVVAGVLAGAIADAAGADKNGRGFAIYITLAGLGVVVPSGLAYWRGKVLDIPTLFATIAKLRSHAHWVAIAIFALLVILMVHLALYPWPNYSFSGPT